MSPSEPFFIVLLIDNTKTKFPEGETELYFLC